jgi:hypothetical protein
MHFTTRALRSWHGLGPHELGMLYKLIQAGLSFETGRGIVSLGRWATEAGRSRRQVIRYANRFVELGVLERRHRFWETARPKGDFNRANEWSLQIRLADEGLERSADDVEFNEATQAPFEEAEIHGPPVAQDASEAAAAPPLADTLERPGQAAARVAADASCGSGPGDAGAVEIPVLGPEVVCVLGTLQGLDELASIATEEAAVRLWRVGRRYDKTLATVQQALKDAAADAAGATGVMLERLAAKYVRAARQVEQAATAEDKARERAREREIQRRLDEKAEQEREQRRRANAALNRAPP